jgi:hypothetical protein
MTWKLIVAAFATWGLTTLAHAQDVIIEGDPPSPNQSAAPEETLVIQERAPGPRVYGWTMRPADCGTFRCWHGVRCADARDEPPVPR